jgi:nucleoside-diphosphate-sugar epimerase
MQKIVAVTGASGFIGGAVVDACRKRGREVRALTRRQSTKTAGSFAVGEIGPNTRWSEALQGVECVVHCAARAHVLKEKTADALGEFRRVNRDGTLRLAEQAVASGVRRFVFLSSIGVMGQGTDGRPPFSEVDEAKPTLDYAVSKWEAEQGLRDIAERTGLEVVSLRPPLVYGPAAPGNFDRLMRPLLRGLPLPLGWVDGNQRSYIGIQNLVDLIMTCIDHPAAVSQTFLVSDGEDVSTAELIRRMGIALEKSPRLLPVPVWMLKLGAGLAGKASIAQSLCGSLQLDGTKARRLLGWQPPLSLDEGLKQAAEGYLREASV